MAAQPHALIFPYPALGHIRPLFNLAQHLSSLGFLCTFLTPARYHSRLPHSHQLTSANIRLVAAADGLPVDPSYDPPVPDVARSLAALEKNVELLLRSSTADQNPVTCFVSDNVIPWVQAVADRNGVPRVDFWPFSATAVSMVYHMPLLASEGHIPYLQGKMEEEDQVITCIPGLPNMRPAEFVEHLLVKDTSHPVHRLYSRAHEQVDGAKWVFIHSVFELEMEAIKALQSKKLKVYPVGPLFSFDELKNGDVSLGSSGTEDSQETCLEWLDSQAPLSVLYVAFGTTGSWTAAEMMELAAGLEASQQPFLWAVRSTSFLADYPSDYFSGETNKRGLIIPWAPQFSVLNHPSVGGFLTHCGWNSVLESIYMGVPMIGWPKVSDQTTNMRLISSEWKVGIALGNSRGSIVTRTSIENAVRTLFKGEEGKDVRTRAVELRGIVRSAVREGGSSRLNLQEFAKEMTLEGGRRSLA